MAGDGDEAALGAIIDPLWREIEVSEINGLVEMKVYREHGDTSVVLSAWSARQLADRLREAAEKCGDVEPVTVRSEVPRGH
jgi:hypothetical protein